MRWFSHWRRSGGWPRPRRRLPKKWRSFSFFVPSDLDTL